MDAHLSREHFAAEIRAAMARAEGKPMGNVKDGCAYWVADIYKRVLAVDPAASWRRRYCTRTNEEAEAALGQRGFLRAMIRAANRMRWPMITPQQARPGDFGLIAPLGKIAPAIFDGGLWLSRIDGGYGGYPHKAVVRAWSVL